MTDRFCKLIEDLIDGVEKSESSDKENALTLLENIYAQLQEAYMSGKIISDETLSKDFDKAFMASVQKMIDVEECSEDDIEDFSNVKEDFYTSSDEDGDLPIEEP